MVRIITNRIWGIKADPLRKNRYNGESVPLEQTYLPRNAKLLAWSIFLIFFIENGTLGIFPPRFYFIYRNVRLSDIIMYGVIVYSLFYAKEYRELMSSRTLIIVKLIFIYIFLQFIASFILYDYGNPIEFFFRLKGIWSSFLIFPFMLLLKRKALPYFIKIFFPFAVLSNILYILSSVTGTAFMPDIGIEKQQLPGGLQVYRVFGGTFFGELFFLGFIYFWITKKFKSRQLIIVILFIIPHILAFGRSAWIYFLVTILIIFVWNIIKEKNFKILARQFVIALLLVTALFYAFATFIPESSYLSNALEVRVVQGGEDYKYETGTYGTRIANMKILLELWQKSNILFGIGMHPMWIIKPVTQEEALYRWGFSDIRWAGVLAAYGLVGFLLFAAFQIYYGAISFKIILKSKTKDLYMFIIILLFCRLFFDTVISYSYNLLSVGIGGIPSYLSFYLAFLVYSYEYKTYIAEPKNKFITG